MPLITHDNIDFQIVDDINTRSHLYMLSYFIVRIRTFSYPHIKTLYMLVCENVLISISVVYAKTLTRSSPTHFLNSRHQFSTRVTGHTTSTRFAIGTVTEYGFCSKCYYVYTKIKHVLRSVHISAIDWMVFPTPLYITRFNLNKCTFHRPDVIHME